MYYKTVQDDTVAGLPLAINNFIKLTFTKITIFKPINKSILA